MTRTEPALPWTTSKSSNNPLNLCCGLDSKYCKCYTIQGYIPKSLNFDLIRVSFGFQTRNSYIIKLEKFTYDLAYENVYMMGEIFGPPSETIQNVSMADAIKQFGYDILNKKYVGAIDSNMLRNWRDTDNNVNYDLPILKLLSLREGDDLDGLGVLDESIIVLTHFDFLNILKRLTTSIAYFPLDEEFTTDSTAHHVKEEVTDESCEPKTSQTVNIRVQAPLNKLPFGVDCIAEIHCKNRNVTFTPINIFDYGLDLLFSNCTDRLRSLHLVETSTFAVAILSDMSIGILIKDTASEDDIDKRESCDGVDINDILRDSLEWETDFAGCGPVPFYFKKMLQHNVPADNLFPSVKVLKKKIGKLVEEFHLKFKSKDTIPVIWTYTRCLELSCVHRHPSTRQLYFEFIKKENNNFNVDIVYFPRSLQTTMQNVRYGSNVDTLPMEFQHTSKVFVKISDSPKSSLIIISDGLNALTRKSKRLQDKLLKKTGMHFSTISEGCNILRSSTNINDNAENGLDQMKNNSHFFMNHADLSSDEEEGCLIINETALETMAAPQAEEGVELNDTPIDTNNNEGFESNGATIDEKNFVEMRDINCKNVASQDPETLHDDIMTCNTANGINGKDTPITPRPGLPLQKRYALIQERNRAIRAKTDQMFIKSKNGSGTKKLSESASMTSWTRGDLKMIIKSNNQSGDIKISESQITTINTSNDSKMLPPQLISQKRKKPKLFTSKLVKPLCLKIQSFDEDTVNCGNQSSNVDYDEVIASSRISQEYTQTDSTSGRLDTNERFFPVHSLPELASPATQIEMANKENQSMAQAQTDSTSGRLDTNERFLSVQLLPEWISPATQTEMTKEENQSMAQIQTESTSGRLDTNENCFPVQLLPELASPATQIEMANEENQSMAQTDLTLTLGCLDTNERFQFSVQSLRKWISTVTQTEMVMEENQPMAQTDSTTGRLDTNEGFLSVQSLPELASPATQIEMAKEENQPMAQTQTDSTAGRLDTDERFLSVQSLLKFASPTTQIEMANEENQFMPAVVSTEMTSSTPLALDNFLRVPEEIQTTIASGDMQTTRTTSRGNSPNISVDIKVIVRSPNTTINLPPREATDYTQNGEVIAAHHHDPPFDGQFGSIPSTSLGPSVRRPSKRKSSTRLPKPRIANKAIQNHSRPMGEQFEPHRHRQPVVLQQPSAPFIPNTGQAEVPTSIFQPASHPTMVLVPNNVPQYFGNPRHVNEREPFSQPLEQPNNPIMYRRYSYSNERPFFVQNVRQPLHPSDSQHNFRVANVYSVPSVPQISSHPTRTSSSAAYLHRSMDNEMRFVRPETSSNIYTYNSTNPSQQSFVQNNDPILWQTQDRSVAFLEYQNNVRREVFTGPLERPSHHTDNDFRVRDHLPRYPPSESHFRPTFQDIPYPNIPPNESLLRRNLSTNSEPNRQTLQEQQNFQYAFPSQWSTNQYVNFTNTQRRKR